MNKQTKLDDMFQVLSDIMKPFTEMLELSAIWYNGKRYAKGDEVNYDSTDTELIVKDPNNNTHKILKCMGTIGDTKHEMLLENISTNEQITITL